MATDNWALRSLARLTHPAAFRRLQGKWVMCMGGPDVDVGLGQGGEHGGGYSFPGTHLVAHSSQHAAVVYLLDLADAPSPNCLAKPAQKRPSQVELRMPTETEQHRPLHGGCNTCTTLVWAHAGPSQQGPLGMLPSATAENSDMCLFQGWLPQSCPRESCWQHVSLHLCSHAANWEWL